MNRKGVAVVEIGLESINGGHMRSNVTSAKLKGKGVAGCKLGTLVEVRKVAVENTIKVFRGKSKRVDITPFAEHKMEWSG